MQQQYNWMYIAGIRGTEVLCLSGKLGGDIQTNTCHDAEQERHGLPESFPALWP